MLMLHTPLYAGVTGIARDVSFLAVLQLIDLCNVRHIRRRTHQVMYQVGFGLDTDVHFQPEEIHFSFV